MNLIRVLPEIVASQIAAGEVVDRPASVIKELIDNSFDAGANRIIINIEQGGKRVIKVRDNGIGLSRDDLLLCVERHATSKIRIAADLFSVKSFGFRGEALSSIASVSKLQMISRPHDEITGHRFKISGGKFLAIEETGAPPGTTVQVKELFFNTPARRKFLRSVRTETNHIIDILSRMALPFPNISFMLDDGGKTIMNLPASDQPLTRISALIGRKVADAMTEVQEEDHDLTITGYLAPSDFSRTRGNRLFIYINNRHIRDRLITRAIMEGYGQRLMKGQYPQAVIFIQIDPSKVDVNVHPTKQEVRFHNSNAVYKTIASAIGKGLNKSLHAFFEPAAMSKGKSEQEYGFHFLSEPASDYKQTTQDISHPSSIEEPEYFLPDRGLRVIGQLANTYILCQVKDGLLIVDQHAAHERIVYETLKKDFDVSRIESQGFLIPHKLEMTLREKNAIMEKKEQLLRFGVELDHFGGNTFLLRSVPNLLRNVKWDAFMPEFLAELEETHIDDATVIDKVLTVMACHGAIRAGDHMTPEEMIQLLNQLEKMELPTNCPHGRPIFKQLTYHEIEKMLKRIV